MNYGEEDAYWYLRLNGFFPIANVVVHQSANVRYTSDCDILAVRLPHVYEEIGGNADDWDSDLKKRLNYNRIVGVICEVKTGRYDPATIFRADNIRYSIGRLGFVPTRRIETISRRLTASAVINLDRQFQMCKLLVANVEKGDGNFIFRELRSVRAFLEQRVRRYPKEKYRDRMFFGSILFQDYIDRVALAFDAQEQSVPAANRASGRAAVG